MADREEVYRRWMAGSTPRAIAKALQQSIADVEAEIDASQDKSDARHRLRGWQRDLERIDLIIARNVRDALDFKLPIQHSQAAAYVAERLMHRKAAMLGTDAPVRIDAVQLVHHSGHVTTNTDKIEQVLNRLITDQSKAGSEPSS